MAHPARPVGLIVLAGSLALATQIGMASRFDTTPSRSKETHSDAIVETRGAFIGISVPDVQASANWYSEKLGLQVIFQPPPSGPSTVIVLEGGGLIVELLQDNRAVPLSQAAPSITANYLVHGIFKAGVIVKHFDRLVASLNERGIPIALGPFPETAEQPANLLIRDNAGNLIQFIAE